MNTPAQVVRKLLILKGIVPDSKTVAWSPFVSFLPDAPDSAMAIYDTAGVIQGRLMQTGEKIEKPGIQVRVRSTNYALAWNKAKEVANAFDTFAPGTVVEMSEEESWRFQNISRTSSILSSGIEEEGDRKRHNFTINAILTIREIAAYYEFQVLAEYSNFYVPYLVTRE